MVRIYTHVGEQQSLTARMMASTARFGRWEHGIHCG